MLKQLFEGTVPGITTWAKQEEAVYLQDNLSGETVQIGVFDKDISGPGNRMIPVTEGFKSLGIAALEKYAASEHEWISIDEIGYLETQCEPYLEAVLNLFEKKQVVAVVRKQNIPFLEELCKREDVFLIDMDNPFGNAGCVIMASGFGRRFGSNKLMTDFGGEPLICRVLDATDGIFAKRVVVTRYEDVAQICRERGIDAVLHDLPYRSDTVRLGLQAIDGIDRCMFIPADQPLLKRETISSLCLASANDFNSIWRTAYKNNPGSPVIFPKWTFLELQNLPEGKGGSVVIKKYPERVQLLNVRDADELKDADTPNDLKELLNKMNPNASALEKI